MIITKSIPFRTMVSWISFWTLFLLLYIVVIAVLYYYEIIQVALPVLPVTLIGTAVAFYVGFKNNNAYDRMWEARKIWGSIVNNSRTWAMQVDGYISDVFDDHKSPEELTDIKRVLVRRHIGWLYQLRRQLLEVQPWEHASQNNHEGRAGRRYQQQYGIGLYTQEASEVTLDRYISREEYERISTMANPATQLLAQQERDLLMHRKELVIDDFRHVAMSDILRLFYGDQGKCERINKFPLPRQYAVSARVFTNIFILLVPFTVMPIVYQAVSSSSWAAVISILLTALVAWVYFMMENVGDYSENPFQGMANDIPTLSMSRTIEIDMLQIIGETDTPPPIGPKKGVLM